MNGMGMNVVMLMMSCENCSNYLGDGLECLMGHVADCFDVCGDWLYGGDD